VSEQQELQSKVQRLSCIVCPMSCVGEVEIADGKVIRMVGFTCERGRAYAKSEVTAPQRVLTTTVKIHDGALRLLPVVSRQPLPKDKIAACVRCLASVEVEAPVKEGDIISGNILGLGVDIVASRDVRVRQAAVM
jgi:CxxC motif-containing protein